MILWHSFKTNDINIKDTWQIQKDFAFLFVDKRKWMILLSMSTKVAWNKRSKKGIRMNYYDKWNKMCSVYASVAKNKNVKDIMCNVQRKIKYEILSFIKQKQQTVFWTLVYCIPIVFSSAKAFHTFIILYCLNLENF